MTLDLIEGTIVGEKYRLVCPVGTGGMGAVWAASNLVTHKRVALKFMHPQLAIQPPAVERFLREAQVTSSLRHPNVVDVYDALVGEQLVVIVMELLEGEPLTGLLTRGTATIPTLINFLIDAMRGTASAHKQGVVHRDIKPANIFLAREDGVVVPKVLDFGIAKMRSGLISPTSTGGPIGTPLYMSLEQLNNTKDIDGRADVYAFGVILYQAATGQPPYAAETWTELAIKIATTEPPSPRALSPKIPEGLNHIIEWAMAKDRERRLPALDVFIRELEHYRSEESFRRHMSSSETSLPHAGYPEAGRAPGNPSLTSSMTSPSRPYVTVQSLRESRPITGAPPREILGAKVKSIAYGAAGLGALLLTAAFAYLLQHLPQPNPQPPAAGSEAHVLRPAGSRAPLPVVRRIVLRSEPVGAQVFELEPVGLLGVAPFEVAVEPSRTFELRLDGFAPERVRVDRDTQDELIVSLKVLPSQKPDIKPPVTPRKMVSRGGLTSQPASTPGVVEPVAPKTVCQPSRPWTAIPMPGPTFLGGIFNASARRRREALLTYGPACRSVNEVDRAFSQGLIDKQTRDDTLWTLQTARDHALERAKYDLDHNKLDQSAYQRQTAAITARFQGPAP